MEVYFLQHFGIGARGDVRIRGPKSKHMGIKEMWNGHVLSI